MRILHVTPTFYPSVGGIQEVIFNLCKNLSNNGHVSDVAHISSNHDYAIELIDDFKVFRIPSYGSKFLFIAPRIFSLASEYDIIHLHDPQLLSLTINIRLFVKRKPIILSTHGGYHHTKNYKYYKYLHKKILLEKFLNFFSIVMASSKSDYLYFSKYTNKIALVENGVNVERFNKIVNKSVNPYRWIYWGRLASHKRIDKILDLVSFSQKSGYPVEIIICGDDFDSTKVKLMDRISILGLNNASIINGLSNEILDKVISESGVYISASEYEGFGLTIIEALSSGLPVIARDIEPIRSFLKYDNGLLLDFNGSELDDERILDFLYHLPENIKLYSINAINSVKSYDWNIRIKEYINNYTSVYHSHD